MTNKLQVIAQENGLEPTENLISKFGGHFEKAKKLKEEAKEIVVTDENDFEGMDKARVVRLAIQKIRTKGVEKLRKEMKAQIVRDGKAIDGFANIIKALIVPVEEHLMKQEKFAENKQLEKIEDKYNDRVEKLSVYIEDISVYSLREMSDEAFEAILKSNKDIYESRIKAEEDAEKALIKKEKEEKLYSERRMILAPYSDFIDLSNLTIDTNQTDYEEMVSTAKQSKDTHDENQKKIREENEKLKKAQEKLEAKKQKELDVERKKTEEAENKLKLQKEAIEREMAKEKAEKLAEEEKERKALIAPDKEKLMNLIADYDEVELPNVKSKKANDILIEVERRERILTDWIYEEAKKL